MREARNYSWLKPLGKVCLDKLFNPIAAGQAQPYRAAFALGSEVDIEERTANPFPGGPFLQELVGLQVGGKLELNAVGQFPGSGCQGAQCGTEFVEVALALFRAESQPVTGERSLML